MDRLKEWGRFYSTTYASPIGLLTLACDGQSLVGLWIEGQKYHGGVLAGAMTEDDSYPVFAAAKSWLDGYFAGKRPGSHELPLAPIGSVYRQAVWTLLKEIPYGKTVTYGSLALSLAAGAAGVGAAGVGAAGVGAAGARGIRGSARAVGGAVGHNPISIIIPCHRVIGSDGSLTGYAGGLEIKKKLLYHEGAEL